MFTVNSCTGDLIPTTPAIVTTRINPGSMVVDPLDRFVYAANLVSNAADQATISNTPLKAMAPCPPQARPQHKAPRYRWF